MSYILKDSKYGYFNGVIRGDAVVWTQSQAHAQRFQSRDLAELTLVGYCPDARIVKLRRPTRST